jgi:hypothetical protein
MADYSAINGLKPAKMHGWISPEGKYHHMAPKQDHAKWIHQQLKSKHDSTEKSVKEGLKSGWISVGHAGSRNAAVHPEIIKDKHHPAVKKLRDMVKEHHPGTDFGLYVHEEGKGKMANVDSNHFSKHGTVKPIDDKMKKMELIKFVFGSEVFSDLNKSDIFKPNSKTIVDPMDFKIGHDVVPKVLLFWLTKELVGLPKEGIKDVELPGFITRLPDSKIVLHVNKVDSGMYSGEIREDGKILTSFTFRSIPGIGLILLNEFELYDMKLLENEPKQEEKSDIDTKIDDIIKERLKLLDLVEQVVDKKLNEREAIDRLVQVRLAQALKPESPIKTLSIEPIRVINPEDKDKVMKRELKLKEFLDNRAKKKDKIYKVQMTKSEVACPDCGRTIIRNEKYTGCVCFGSDCNNELAIQKSENSAILKFDKSWDKDNIETLLKILGK